MFVSYAVVVFGVTTPPTIPYPKVNYGTDPLKQLIQRGEYLAKAGDCIACHTDTDNNGAPFAGGLGIKTPFGTFYTPNITSDKETGIGNWTNKDFINAMHHGLNPRGQNYFPVFPYPYFNKVSEEDLIAIKAYLDHIPAVNNQPFKNDVPFPFNVRLMQYGWKILFFYPYSGYFKPDSTQSAQWNRGAYLVEGLGHCSMCHTPINPFGAPKRAYYLSGGIVDNYPAPSINVRALSQYTPEQITQVFTHDKMLGGGSVAGPMLDVNHNSLRYLSQEDLLAIATYLKTVNSKEIPKPKLSGGDVGKGIYEAYCTTCHATGAAGAPIVGNATDWAPRIKLGINTLVTHAITGLGSMPAKGTCTTCTDEEIKATVEYMVRNSEGPNATKSNIAAPIGTPSLTLTEGRRVYDESCAQCHNTGKLGAPKLGDGPTWDKIVQQNMDVLFGRAINGYKSHPPRGGCEKCTDGEIEAAVVYMVQTSQKGGDYKLWL